MTNAAKYRLIEIVFVKDSTIAAHADIEIIHNAGQAASAKSTEKWPIMNEILGQKQVLANLCDSKLIY